VRRLAVIGAVLLLGMLTGLAFQPDDGTAVSRPPDVGTKVDGANHAKPLPRLPSMAAILAVVAVSAVALVRLQRRTWVVVTRSERVAVRIGQLLGLPALARRGPPSLAL
jgi:hypothetical protein